jgi:hypothetical protein
MTTASTHAYLRIEGEGGEFAVYDDRAPETAEFNYGLVADGFASRAQAERAIALRRSTPDGPMIIKENDGSFSLWVAVRKRPRLQ